MPLVEQALIVKEAGNKKGSSEPFFVYLFQLAPDYIPYFLRNLSTRPAVSTIFCLPV